MSYFDLGLIFDQINMRWIPDFIGCVGTFIILLTYYLLQARKLASTTVLYSILNLGGALLILISLMYSWNLPAVLMEIAWVVISLYGIIKDIFSSDSKTSKKPL